MNAALAPSSGPRMAQIGRESLLSLEDYARVRNEFRARVMEHKKHRTVHVGANLTLLFEDELTIRYQIQEMLRIERIFEDQAIRDELETYNPLIPDGGNWKATMLLEYPEVEERRQRLAELIGIEDCVWVQVDGCKRVPAIADEDLPREDDVKTSSVHFLRFELSREMREALRRGAGVRVGVDHPNYRSEVRLGPETRSALAGDLS